MLCLRVNLSTLAKSTGTKYRYLKILNGIHKRKDTRKLVEKLYSYKGQLLVKSVDKMEKKWN